MEQKIKNIMATTFGVDINTIDENSSPDTIQSWDSLKHLQLFLSLEEEFNIVFTDDEILNLLNYQAILDAIRKKR